MMHVDIKAGNVLVADNGITVKISDFGEAVERPPDGKWGDVAPLDIIGTVGHQVGLRQLPVVGRLLILPSQTSPASLVATVFRTHVMPQSDGRCFRTARSHPTMRSSSARPL
jgi:hypothetical protein